MKKALASLVLCAGLILAVPAFAELIIGPPNGGPNCFPFGCGYNAEYQQVYTHTAFGGPILITNLEFFNTVYDDLATQMNSGNWAIYLSTTSADWNTISGTYPSNIGADNTLVFSGNLNQPWAFGDTLHIQLTTGFLYDPANGNLLMDIVTSGVTSPGGAIFFDATSGSLTSRVFCYGGIACSPNGNANYGYGLVTGFSSTPEPGTLALMGTGLVGVMGAVRRRLRG